MDYYVLLGVTMLVGWSLLFALKTIVKRINDLEARVKALEGKK